MAQEKTKNAAKEVVFDLLSKRESLIPAEVKVLQSALNQENEGAIKINRINGTLGPETGNAIIFFLRNNPLFVPQLSDGIRHAVEQEGLGNILVQAPGGRGGIGGRFAYGDAASLLTQDLPLSPRRMEALQSKLGLAHPSGVMDMPTAKKIVELLQRNPDVLGKMNFSILRQLTDRNDRMEGYDLRASLAEACRHSREYQARVNGLSDGLEKRPMQINPAVYELQILLKAGGFGKGYADGMPGQTMIDGINDFAETVHPASPLQQAWRQGMSGAQPPETSPIPQAPIAQRPAVPNPLASPA